MSFAKPSVISVATTYCVFLLLGLLYVVFVGVTFYPRD
jgi:hypothetical protein